MRVSSAPGDDAAAGDAAGRSASADGSGPASDSGSLAEQPGSGDARADGRRPGGRSRGPVSGFGVRWPGSGGGGDDGGGAGASGEYGQSTWAKMMISLPLEVAAAASRSDSHYLQKRKRKQWWSTGEFPRVCCFHRDTPQLYHPYTARFSTSSISCWQCQTRTLRQLRVAPRLVLTRLTTHAASAAAQCDNLPRSNITEVDLCVCVSQVPPEDVAHIELPAPPISLWQKCIPLAIVFFCASFNLVRCIPPKALCNAWHIRSYAHPRQTACVSYAAREPCLTSHAGSPAKGWACVCRRSCKT